MQQLGLKQPPNRTARTPEEALAHARVLGYPLVVRPSYVLGGRAMEVVHSVSELKRYVHAAVKVSKQRCEAQPTVKPEPARASARSMRLRSSKARSPGRRRG